MRSPLLSAPTLTVLLLLMIVVAGLIEIGWTHSVYASADSASLTEWTIPTPGSTPTRMALDPAGSCCWFIETTANKIARLEPSSGLFQEWQIPTSASRPAGLATAKISGSTAIFGTEFATNKIFVFFPDSRVFKEYTLPTPESAPWQISIEASDSEIRAWFSELGTTGTRNAIGQLVYNPNSGPAELFEWELPEEAGGGANGVYATAGAPWFAGRSAIVKLDRSANESWTWRIPSHASNQAAFITIDSLDQVWYTARSPGATVENYVGVLMEEKNFKEWQFPTENTDPRVISIDPLTQSPWIVETEQTGGEGRITKLEPWTGGVVSGTTPTVAPSIPILSTIEPLAVHTVAPRITKVSPTSRSLAGSTAGEFAEWLLGTGSFPQDVVVDSSGDVWMLESGNNKVAKLTMSDPDFSIKTSTPAISVKQGIPGGISITGTSIRGFSGPITLSLAGMTQSGVTFTFTPNPLSIPQGGSMSATLIINAASDAKTGISKITVLGTDDSLRTRPASFLLLTTPSVTRDFHISISPSYMSVASGSSVSSTVNVHSIGGFNSFVALSYASVPGVTVDFETNPVSPPPNGTASSAMSILVGASMAADTVSIIITGISGSLSHSSTLVLSIAAAPSGCFIATATYGSELSPEVTMLRNFRDRGIQRTLAGSSFMIAFNAWYYSFSPHVAEYLSGHWVERTAMRGLMYPLIGILSLSSAVFGAAHAYPELAAVLAGLLASSMIGLLYIGLPLGLMRAKIVRLRGTRAERLLERLLAIVLLIGIAGLIIGELLASTLVLIPSTSVIVLSALFLSALVISGVLARFTGSKT